MNQEKWMNDGRRETWNRETRTSEEDSVLTLRILFSPSSKWVLDKRTIFSLSLFFPSVEISSWARTRSGEGDVGMNSRTVLKRRDFPTLVPKEWAVNGRQEGVNERMNETGSSEFRSCPFFTLLLIHSTCTHTKERRPSPPSSGGNSNRMRRSFPVSVYRLLPSQMVQLN